jgi:hypothetical protein
MSGADYQITQQLAQVPDDQLDGMLDLTDDDMAPEGRPEDMLAWLLEQPDRTRWQADIDALRQRLR